jgi:hypothetical protein
MDFFSPQETEMMSQVFSPKGVRLRQKASVPRELDEVESKKEIITAGHGFRLLITNY